VVGGMTMIGGGSSFGRGSKLGRTCGSSPSLDSEDFLELWAVVRDGL